MLVKLAVWYPWASRNAANNVIQSFLRTHSILYYRKRERSKESKERRVNLFEKYDTVHMREKKIGRFRHKKGKKDIEKAWSTSTLSRFVITNTYSIQKLKSHKTGTEKRPETHERRLATILYLETSNLLKPLLCPCSYARLGSTMSYQYAQTVTWVTQFRLVDAMRRETRTMVSEAVRWLV